MFSTVLFTLKHLAFQLSKCINHVNMLLQFAFEGRLCNSFLRLHILRCCHTFKIMNSNDPFSIVYLLGNCVGNYLLRIQRKPNLINNEWVVLPFRLRAWVCLRYRWFEIHYAFKRFAFIIHCKIVPCKHLLKINIKYSLTWWTFIESYRRFNL